MKRMVSFRRRWFLLATALVVSFESASSFPLVSRVYYPVITRGRGQSLTTTNHCRSDSRRRDIRRWSSAGGEGSKDPQDPSSSESYRSLYEFLTRRSGEQAGDSERKRKRDRIREWMSSSSSSSSTSSSTTTGTAGSSNGGGTNLVRPIRMEDGSVVEDDPPRTQVRFDKLFAGMPTLEDILTRDGANSQPPATAEPPSEKLRDDSWFEEEKRDLEAQYEQIIKDIKEQIQQQRQEDPDAMPENAEGVAESIVRQELDRMLSSVKTRRAKERLQAYEMDKISELDAQDMTGMKDDVVDRIIMEAADELKRKQAVQAQIDDFVRYERESASLGSSSDSSVPLPGADLDAWALERLEDMLRQTKIKASDDAAAVTDILEQQIDDLRDRIAAESKKGSIKPQTMKEWQMYRAIATRLGRQRGFDPLLDASLNLGELDEQQAAKQLDAWREYIGKEQKIRQRSGLSVGASMPFDWQQASKHPDEDQIPITSTRATSDPKTRRELRREVNLQAIQAFEALVEKGGDPARVERIKKQLETLRAELEPLDYIDVEEASIVEEKLGPVDLSDVFGTKEKSDSESALPSNLYDMERDAIDRVLSSDAETVYLSETKANPPQGPPSTSFFSEAYEDKPPTPKTAFFDELYTIDIQNTKLGSADDQKLLNMYRKAGARTKVEQDAIREQWLAYQALEKSKRDESGLSDEDASSLTDKVNLKYDISEVMKSDGDFDADKILSTIGPRPTRKKKDSDQTGSGAIEPSVDEKLNSGLDPGQVSESLFRSVAAVGGGRVKDNPEIKNEEKAKFEDYLQKEEEMRQSLDSLDEAAKKLALESDIAIDDPSYAQDVLASIGPRPVFKKPRKQTLDARELSDRGGVAASDDEDDVDDEDDESVDADDDFSASLGLVPDWLKKERAAIKKKKGFDDSSPGFAGRNIDEMFDDDQYDHNLRQLHEYEQRRAGKQKQMGIDISDILGKSARSSDDYADYSYDTDYGRGRQEAWGSTSFEARKANLLDYLELTARELNNLMDHRDSVYATGVSQYLPRINKPFKEFGAIFRLEGVLVDLTGLHRRAWTKVAAEFDFRAPTEDDVARAAVVRPDAAIREVFYWTNDVFVVRKAMACFNRVFRDVFGEWAKSNGIVEQPKPKKGVMALGSEQFSGQKPPSPAPASAASKIESEQGRLKRFQEAWLLTAKELELSSPTNEQIAQSTFLTPDIAVREVFRWTSDQMEIDAVVSVFTAIFNGEVDTSRLGMDVPFTESQKVQKENPLLEAQFRAWTKVAEGRSLDAPTPEEVLAAAVLNDPEAVIVKGFGWTDSPDEARGLAKIYREYLAEFLSGQRQPQPPAATTVYTAPTVEEDTPSNAVVGPTDEEVLESQVKAWSETAAKHSFTAPKPEQIQLIMNSSPSDAVRRLLGWTYNFNEDQISVITQTYSEALKKASEKYIKAYNVEMTTTAAPKVEISEYKRPSADELFQASFEAWTNVAWQSGFSLPNQDQVQFAMSVGPDEAIVVGFQWTNSYEKAAEIADIYRKQIDLKRTKWMKQGYNLSSSGSSRSDQGGTEHPLVSVKPGVSDWVKSLLNVEMACGLTSYLDEDQVIMLLQYAGMSELFPADKCVSKSSGYDRDVQQLLGVALRIERRPDHCVLFDSSPGANVAAHEAEMRSVSLVGPYPRYELLSADTSACSFDELTAMNIRRLFGERVYDQPMLDMVQNQPKVTRKIKTAFWDDE